ncbi:MAG TPA: ABC transporter permease [Desulfitobacteriaceae bacterium]|nr:ABC transporter permease [Desulfitobacteriaceae bacterium]
MNCLRITCYTVLRNLRNWKLFLLLIVLPFLNYLIWGYILTNLDLAPKFEKVKAAYLAADSGPIAQQFEEFLQAKEIQPAFIIQKTDTFADGNRMVKSGQIEDFIFIPDDFSQNLEQGKETRIEIYSNQIDSATRLLVESFINKVNSSSAINKIGGDSNLREVSDGIQQIAVSPTGIILKDADKYQFFGLLNMLSFGALLGSFSVINSLKKNILVRFNISPINSFAYVGGQLLGNFISLCPSSIMFIAYMYYVWGAFMQGNILNIFQAFMLFTIITTALGMIAGYLTRRTGLSVLVVVCLTGLFASAAIMWALGTAHGFLKGILVLSPQYHTYLIVTDTVFEGFTSRIQASLIALAISATVLIVLTLIWGRRKAV